MVGLVDVHWGYDLAFAPRPDQGHLNGYPKWNPGKWNQGPTPVVPWWSNFDPHPFLPNVLENVRPMKSRQLWRAARPPACRGLTDWMHLLDRAGSETQPTGFPEGDRIIHKTLT